MSREEIYSDMKSKLGLVPTMFQLLPDRSLQLEWELFQRLQMEESPIPNKYRELIGLAIAGVSKCRYCTFFHTEFAKRFGATEQEIEDAVHFGKSVAGWSAYVNGMQVDFDQFKSDVLQIIEHLKSSEA